MNQCQSTVVDNLGSLWRCTENNSEHPGPHSAMWTVMEDVPSFRFPLMTWGWGQASGPTALSPLKEQSLGADHVRR